MNDKITVKQLALLLLLIIPGGKYLDLPCTLAKETGKDCWLVVVLLLAVDFVCLCFLLWAIVKNVNSKDFYQIIRSSLGVVSAKIITAVFACLFLLRTVVLLGGIYNLFAVTFAIRSNYPVFVLPVTAFAVFAVSKGLRSVARLNQILLPSILISLLVIIIYPSVNADFSELLPIAEDGLAPVFRSALTKGFWFADYLFIYFAIGKIKVEKSVFAPVLTCFGIGAVLIVSMNLLFVSLYGNLAPQTDLAMARVAQFFVTGSDSGRLDWLFISLWATSVIIKVAVFTFCSYQALACLFDVKTAKLNPWLTVAVCTVNLLPLFVSTKTIFTDWLNYLSIPFAVVNYLLPLAMPFLVNKCNKKAVNNA